MGVRETESEDDSKLLGLRTRQTALSCVSMGKTKEEHLERKMGQSRVPGEWGLITLSG